MNENNIIKEISEILILKEGFEINKTPIEFDSLSSLMLVEFLDSNFDIKITKDEISSFSTIKSVLNFIDKKSILNLANN